MGSMGVGVGVGKGVAVGMGVAVGAGVGVGWIVVGTGVGVSAPGRVTGVKQAVRRNRAVRVRIRRGQNRSAVGVWAVVGWAEGGVRGGRRPFVLRRGSG